MTTRSTLSHDRAFELLPWLVNGTLAEADREAVEEHTRACIACRRELKEQQRLNVAVRARRTADVSAEAGFDQLDRELDDAASTHPFWRKHYAAVAPFAVAAAAGVAVLAILLWFTPPPNLGGQTYSTLATAPTGEAVLLDVVFTESATAAEMQALLDDIGGEIVAGPSALGRYSVRVADTRANDARLTELLGTLAGDRRVRFAGRSLTEPVP